MEIVAVILGICITLIWECVEIAFHIILWLAGFYERRERHAGRHAREDAALAYKGIRRAHRHGGWGGTGL